MKICLTLLILSSSLTISQEILFYPSRFDYDMGNSPWSIVSDDFNKDGRMDIVTSNKDGRNITIRLGKGDGFFEDSVNYNVGILPVSLTSTDFNNDKIIDLATANQLSNNISVLLGNGDGTFADSVNYNTDITPRYIINADFNNDTITDIAVANRDAKTISILLGKGDGTFSHEKRFSTGNELFPRMIACGDFNQDNKPDLALIHAYNSPDPVYPGKLGGIMEGDGNGNFILNTVFDLNVYGSFPEAPAIVTSDFNNDNKDDLAITITASDQDYDYCLLLLGSGNYSFNELAPFTVHKKPFSLLAGDFNRDNKIDLAVTNTANSNVSFHQGNGDGTFSEVIYHSTAQYPRCICAADFNNDTFIDFATGNEGGNSFSLLTAKNDLEFVVTPVFEVGEPPHAFPYWGASADLNKNGNKDIIIANWGYPNQNSTISVLLGNGDNSFQPRVNYGVGIAPKIIITEDFNKDTNIDIAVNNDRSHSISVLLGNGDGTFNQAVNYPVGMNPPMLCAADFNEDGNTDLASPDYNTDDIAILFGNGDGTFLQAVYLPVDDGPFALISTDINNDDNADLCLLNSEYNPDVQTYLSIYLGKGNGTFNKMNKIFMADDQPWMITTGNLNDDAFVDLVCIMTGINSIFYLFGNGSGDFTIQTSDYISGPRQAIINDFDNDGYNDIAVSSNYNSNVKFLCGDGQGNFHPYEISFGVEGGAWGIIAENFNNDNSLDLAVTTGIFGADHISILNNYTKTTSVISVNNNLTFNLLQNYPNPFNSETKIKYSLHSDGVVKLKVFNLLGEELKVLLDESQNYGSYEIGFDGSNLPSGIYFYQIVFSDFTATKKMILLK
jgi:hypothetical protein